MGNGNSSPNGGGLEKWLWVIGGCKKSTEGGSESLIMCSSAWSNWLVCEDGEESMDRLRWAPSLVFMPFTGKLLSDREDSPL